MFAAVVYVWAVVRAVEEWLDDGDKWAKLSITVATLGIVYIVMGSSNKHRFGGLFVHIAFLIMGVVLLTILLKRLYSKFKHSKVTKVILVVLLLLVIRQGYLFTTRITQSCA